MICKQTEFSIQSILNRKANFLKVMIIITEADRKANTFIQKLFFSYKLQNVEYVNQNAKDLCDIVYTIFKKHDQ